MSVIPSAYEKPTVSPIYGIHLNVTRIRLKTFQGIRSRGNFAAAFSGFRRWPRWPRFQRSKPLPTLSRDYVVSTSLQRINGLREFVACFTFDLRSGDGCWRITLTSVVQ